MSEQLLRYKYEADVAEAVANVNRFKAEINAANSEIRVAQKEWRVQHYEVEQTLRAFNQVSSMGRMVVNTFNTFTMASFRLESAQRDLRETQMRVAEAQSQLNLAVEAYGPGSSQAVAASEKLRAAQNALEETQARVTQIQQQNTLAYIGFALQIPSVVSNIYGMVKAFSLAKIATESGTVAQWLHAKALIITHALSGPAGWAILGVATAVTAGSLAWLAMNEQQRRYNETLSGTINQTQQLIGLEAELGRMSPMERLHREYVVVKRYYETFSERTTHEEAGSGGSVNVSIGNVQVSANELGSAFDRDRAAEDLAKKIGHKLALKVITR